MLQPPPPPPPTSIKRNTKVIVALIIIVVAVVATIAVVALIFLNPSGGANNPFAPPFDFSISTSESSGTTMQGNSLQTTIFTSTLTGNPQTVSLSADSGSSGIQCNFSPDSGQSGYSSTLTMSVPSYTTSQAYSVTITASGGGKTYSTSYTISVLSAKVSVSGNVETTGIGTNPTRVEFVDTQTGVTYTATLSGNYYSITLDNQHSYAVTVSWDGLLWNNGTYEGGTISVNAPVGQTSMSKNFSG